MAIGRDIIGSLAKQFGYSKELVREALASNQIDPLTASLIGSRIDKMQQTKQEAASRTTVMEDVLAPKPEEVMGQGIAAVPSNLPAEGMAGGGIVAFAEGGELDLGDEEEEKAPSMEDKMLSGLLARYRAPVETGLASLKSAIPQSYEAALAEKGQTPATVRKMMIDAPKKGDYVMPPLDSQRPGISSGGRGHKYEDAVIREAERLGVDPQLALHVLYKETGNLKNPETVRSKAGAIGIMQLMPKTAKGLGVDPMNPEENIRGGITYLKQMMDKYQDPTLALAAYNAGPGRVDRALKSGQGIAALPRETQNYVRMADGGIVAFQNTGLVSGEFGGSDFDTRMPDETVTVEPFVIDPITKEKLFSGYRSPIEAKKEPRREPFGVTKPDISVPTRKTFSDEDEGPYTGQAPAPGISQEQIDKLIGGTPGGEKEDGLMKKYISLLEGREKSAADQRKQDAYLSLLSAGLGMMGGTSPFAAVNIGQGAQAGIATQAAARKTQAAEEAATLKGFGSAAVAQEVMKERQARAAQAQEGKIGTLIANREKQLETAAYNNAVKAGGMNFSMLEPAQQQAAIAREVQRLKSADPLLSKLYQQYGLPSIETVAPAPQQYNKEQILKEYGKK